MRSPCRHRRPPADTTYANRRKSAAILEKLYDQNPQHPGVTHFLIHAYDYHPLAEKGIPAARRYAGIAPAVPHARHMPSHIYSMVGLWEESIASNASAIEIQPDYYHAADFSVYAHLHLAQDAKAKALTDKSIATADRGDRPVTFVNFTAKNATWHVMNWNALIGPAPQRYHSPRVSTRNLIR
jgi:hypothetical protein